jgi:hypothetical protein
MTQFASPRSSCPYYRGRVLDRPRSWGTTMFKLGFDVCALAPVPQARALAMSNQPDVAQIVFGSKEVARASERRDGFEGCEVPIVFVTAQSDELPWRSTSRFGRASAPNLSFVRHLRCWPKLLSTSNGICLARFTDFEQFKPPETSG